MLLIDILTNWLKEIILIVLLAVFLDLILPNSTLQRYVKLVMGLLILMTMLSPVLQLLNTDFTLERISSDILREQQNARGSGWQEIEQTSQRLMDNQQQQSSRYVEQQIAALVQDRVESLYPVKVKQVEVKTDLAESQQGNAVPQIASVYVVLNQTEDEESGGNPGSNPALTGMKPIEPVKPVDPVAVNEIEWEKKQPDQPQQAGMRQGESQAGTQRAEPRAVTASARQFSNHDNKQLLLQIEQDIQRVWNLSSSQVTARYEAEQGG